jgi:hypothetical protein
VIHEAMLAHPGRWSDQTLRAAANGEGVIEASVVVTLLDRLEAVYKRTR